ncbi:MAG TPA: hypothetical protein PLJ29_17610, partial [Leptospiraceae bacterium]|nr:hypothetical protein [Leptospiraceae bacterium]
ILNDGARNEILDFYEFLLFKYGSAQESTRHIGKRFEKYLSESIKVDKEIKFSRDELYDRK